MLHFEENKIYLYHTISLIIRTSQKMGVIVMGVV